jgi:serine/threonine-protein kinase
MGRVLEAWDPLLKRSVALKLLYGRDPEHVRLVLREAQHQAKLDHPNVCRVLETEPAEEQAFIVMTLIHGRSLAELGPALDPTTLARILADVAGAIHAAHKVGIVHRDLKPQNILVEALPGSGWMPFVVDFGLARDLAREDQTLSWARVGTPAYMSPQQARGESPQPADDIYSLGATLHHLLGGAPPHGAVTLRSPVSPQGRLEPPPLRRLLPGAPKDLETITAKCMELDPRARYSSAFELESDLRRFLAGEPIQARPIPLVVKLLRQAQRHRTLAITISVSTLLVAGLLGWILRTRLQARHQLEAAQRFGWMVGDIEQALRIERMLPPHDLRPLTERLLNRMEEIRASTAGRGPGSRGPARLALAQGYLALRNPDLAVVELDQAWQAGYRSPDLSLALARAHGEAYAAKSDREFLELGEDTLEGLRARHLVPARQFLELAVQADPEARGLVEATVLNLEGRHEEALAIARGLARRSPWLYEAQLQEARALVGLGFQAQMALDPQAAGARYAEAERAIQAALTVGRSDEGLYQEALNYRLARAGLGNPFGVPGRGDLRNLTSLVEGALAISPDSPRFWADRLTLACREAEWRITRRQDPSRFITQGLEWINQLRGKPGLAAVAAQKEAWLHLLQAKWQQDSGRDPGRELERAWSCQPKGLVAAQVTIQLAEGSVARDEDPARWVAETESARTAAKLWDQRPGLAILSAHVHTLRAQWLGARGADPGQELETARQALEAGPVQGMTDPWAQGMLAEWCAAALEAGSVKQSEELFREGEGAARSILKAPGAGPRGFGAGCPPGGGCSPLGPVPASAAFRPGGPGPHCPFPQGGVGPGAPSGP